MKGNKEQKCEKCLAHYTGEHQCDGLMKHLVSFNKNKEQSWEERFDDEFEKAILEYPYSDTEELNDEHYNISKFCKSFISKTIEEEVKKERERIVEMLYCVGNEVTVLDVINKLKQ